MDRLVFRATAFLPMTQALTDEQLQHLLNFVGYGNLNTDVWFLGMEEAGGGEDSLRTRLQFRQVEDCAEAHKRLGVNDLHWGKKKIQRTWRGMCYIMLCLEGKEPTRENIRTYQAEQLGRSKGRTLLCELMPIPKPKLHQWDYENLIPQFSSAQDYYQTVRPKRIELLRDLIAENSPKIIVAYGKGFWPDYKSLFYESEFQVKSQFELARYDSTFVLLTDHFTARTMNQKFDHVVDLIKENSQL